MMPGKGTAGTPHRSLHLSGTLVNAPLVADIVGYIAAVIGTVLMLPQVVKSVRTRRADDVSGLMLAAYLTQCVLWDVYGVLIGAVPLIVCNTVAFLIGTAQVVLKFRYRQRPA